MIGEVSILHPLTNPSIDTIELEPKTLLTPAVQYIVTEAV